tara:strand:+ start:520 stop:702 length:183 start_codon:yes stop_codon:yes gene_type:complete
MPVSPSRDRSYQATTLSSIKNVVPNHKNIRREPSRVYFKFVGNKKSSFSLGVGGGKSRLA